jgi:hypothetical protein
VSLCLVRCVHAACSHTYRVQPQCCEVGPGFFIVRLWVSHLGECLQKNDTRGHVVPVACAVLEQQVHPHTGCSLSASHTVLLCCWVSLGSPNACLHNIRLCHGYTQAYLLLPQNQAAQCRRLPSQQQRDKNKQAPT